MITNIYKYMFLKKIAFEDRLTEQAVVEMKLITGFKVILSSNVCMHHLCCNVVQIEVKFKLIMGLSQQLHMQQCFLYYGHRTSY